MAQTFNIPFGTQLAFLYDELLGKEKKTLDAFKSGNFSTPTEYAVAFENLYERSDGKNIGRRTRFADNIFAELNKESPELSENVMEAVRFFGGKGFDNAQTSGIVGNLMAESYPTLLPDTFNKDEDAYGIAQWRGSRLEDLVNFNKNYPNTAPPLNATKTLDPELRGTSSGEKRMASLMDMLMGRRPEEENRSEMTGMNRFFNQRNQATGLTPFQSLGAGMDSLVLRGYGQGEAIREQGLRQAAQDKTNLTAEWFASQPQGALFAEMMKMGVPVAQVYAAYQKMIQGDAVTVGKFLVDRKSGKVLFDGSGGSQATPNIKIGADGSIEITAAGPEKQDQANAMLFGKRMQMADKLITDNEMAGTEFFNVFLKKFEDFGSRAIMPENFQIFDDARRDFVNAVLRRESGAAIAPSEFESAERQYFPVFGDSPAAIEQKRIRRKTATDLLIAASGSDGKNFLSAYDAQLEALAKTLNPDFGTETYDEERKRLEKEKNKNTSSKTKSNKTAGGNDIVDPSDF